MGGYFSSGERGACKHCQPAGFPTGLGSPPSQRDPQGVPHPRAGSCVPQAGEQQWGHGRECVGQAGGPSVGGEKGWGEDVMQGERV